MQKNLVERILDVEEDVSNLKDTVGVGIVSTVNKTARTACVIFPGTEEVSDAFPVMRRNESTAWMPNAGDLVVYILRPSGEGIVLGGIG